MQQHTGCTVCRLTCSVAASCNATPCCQRYRPSKLLGYYCKTHSLLTPLSTKEEWPESPYPLLSPNPRQTLIIRQAKRKLELYILSARILRFVSIIIEAISIHI
uniref:Putative secreted protein n=1 Tax=Anopheles darlingi TaxID=43151 RepID=A0A2M4DFS9_ANODA